MEKKKVKTNGAQGRSKKKVMFVLIGLGVVGIAGTALYFYKKNKQSGSGSLSDFLTAEKQDQSSQNLHPITATPTTTKSIQPKNTTVQNNNGTSDFPIKKGSKGKLVKLIQLALMKKYGNEILPKWGADGQWGQETTDALIAKGYPTEIDKATFDRFIGHGVAESLSISGLLGSDQLKTIRNTRIWNANGFKLPVPKNTIIGDFVDAKDGVTTFETIDNRILFVLTKDISYV